MNTTKLKSFFAAAILFAVCLQVFAFSVTAQNLRSNDTDTKIVDEAMPMTVKSKIAPDLEEKVGELSRGFRADETQKVIIQLKSDTNINEIFGNDLSETEQADILAQEAQSNKQKKGLLMSDLTAVNGRIKKSFNYLGLVSAELPLSQINELIRSENVEYISPDREVKSFGHIGETVGWTNPGIADLGDNNSNTWLTGGVGHIVVIDSGIDPNNMLTRYTDYGGSSKIKYNKDFTGENITGDPYGHGTHVTSLFSGGYMNATGGAYESIANASNIINLRVLNSTGTGAVSNLIAALDWTVANKSAWNIRVINMSLGTPARDSYTTDPLCLAARRAVNAGIVVVASAGNYGKDANGNKQYGTIGSPGIEPSVITVGAVNTFGTDARSDDTVATYSSRGPTRGYQTVNGVRRYDNLIKPDIVAPGNKLVGARAYYNNTENYLARTFTSLRTGSSTVNTEKVMYLSGTSMAAPIVAGAAMGLIQINPNLTPNLVKAILMYSAQPLANANSLEQGAGMLNLDGAVRLTKLVKTTLPTTNGSALLTASLPASQTSSIGGQTVTWGKGVITNYGFLYGNDLMNKWQGMYANGVLVSDSTPFSGSTISKSTTLTSGTLSLYQGAIRNNGVLVSDGTLYMSANAMGGSPSATYNSQGVLVSDGVLISDGVLVSDGNAYSTNILGDNTACMLPAL